MVLGRMIELWIQLIEQSQKSFLFLGIQPVCLLRMFFFHSPTLDNYSLYGYLHTFLYFQNLYQCYWKLVTFLSSLEQTRAVTHLPSKASFSLMDFSPLLVHFQFIYTQIFFLFVVFEFSLWVFFQPFKYKVQIWFQFSMMNTSSLTPHIVIHSVSVFFILISLSLMYFVPS